MKVAPNPKAATCPSELRIDKGICECFEPDNKAFEIAIAAPGDYEGLKLNNTESTGNPAPTTDAELLEAVEADLTASGGFDIDGLEYDSGILKYNASAQEIPEYFIIGGVKIVPDALCTAVKYCEFVGVGTDPALVTVDGVAPDASTITVNADGTLTIVAPNGSDVLIDGNATENCGNCVYNWEA